MSKCQRKKKFKSFEESNLHKIQEILTIYFTKQQKENHGDVAARENNLQLIYICFKIIRINNNLKSKFKLLFIFYNFKS